MSMPTLDTEVGLKIVVGRVRYRAQRHAIQTPTVKGAKATQMKISMTLLVGVIVALQSR